jgi:hypothetical protein
MEYGYLFDHKTRDPRNMELYRADPEYVVIYDYDNSAYVYRLEPGVTAEMIEAWFQKAADDPAARALSPNQNKATNSRCQ